MLLISLKIYSNDFNAASFEADFELLEKDPLPSKAVIHPTKGIIAMHRLRQKTCSKPSFVPPKSAFYLTPSLFPLNLQSDHDEDEYASAEDDAAAEEAEEDDDDANSDAESNPELGRRRKLKTEDDDLVEVTSDIGEDEEEKEPVAKVDKEDAKETSKDDEKKGSKAESDESLKEKREDGDGQEDDEDEDDKVDDDEDRRNPQYIPKRGMFYEHDDRIDSDDEEALKKLEEEKAAKKAKERKSEKISKWGHDKFLELEQTPKSKEELVGAYGYDIRDEDNAPRARRRRRYGRGPNKYTRNWEDEEAYAGRGGGEEGRGGGRGAAGGERGGRGRGRGGRGGKTIDGEREEEFPELGGEKRDQDQQPKTKPVSRREIGRAHV